MKILIQRVLKAEVKVDGDSIGKIKQGMLILVGFTKNDTNQAIVNLTQKVLNLRIFQEDNKAFEKSVLEKKGEILVISQFTLYASCKKGRRPDFIEAAQPEIAKALYQNFITELRKSNLRIETGEFGADMQVKLINDGPATFLLEDY